MEVWPIVSLCSIKFSRPSLSCEREKGDPRVQDQRSHTIYAAKLPLFLISPVWCLFLSHSLIVSEKMSLPFWSSVSWLQAAWWWWHKGSSVSLGCDAAEWCTPHRLHRVTLPPPPIWFGGALHCSLMLSCFKRPGGDTGQVHCGIHADVLTVFCVKVHTGLGSNCT